VGAYDPGTASGAVDRRGFEQDLEAVARQNRPSERLCDGGVGVIAEKELGRSLRASMVVPAISSTLPVLTSSGTRAMRAKAFVTALLRRSVS